MIVETNKDNTLYLPIKQVYFDQIVAGTKKEEYREVKYGITSTRYLRHDGLGNLVLNPAVTEDDEEYYVDDYNDGNFPFLPKQFKYLNIAVGYAKERDTAIVEVDSITFEPAKIFGQGEKKFAWWLIVFHLGNVVQVNRKKAK